MDFRAASVQIRRIARLKKPLLYLLSLQLCVTGFLHLVSPEFFVAIIPPELPAPEWLNLISGLIEIVLGVYLLEPRTRVLAAWGVIALFGLARVLRAELQMKPVLFGVRESPPAVHRDSAGPFVAALRSPGREGAIAAGAPRALRVLRRGSCAPGACLDSFSPPGRR